MMSLEKIFFLLKNAEEKAGELYSQIALSLSLREPGLSESFETLSAEEKIHVRQVDMMHQAFSESKESFQENPQAELLLLNFHQHLDEKKKYFLENAEKMSLTEILSLAWELENQLIEKHRYLLVAVNNEKLKKLFDSLGLADVSHCQSLENLQKKYR